MSCLESGPLSVLVAGHTAPEYTFVLPKFVTLIFLSIGLDYYADVILYFKASSQIRF